MQGVKGVLFDLVRIQVISPDLPSRFRYINSGGIILHNVQQADLLTASFSLSRKDFLAVRKYLEDKGDTVTVISHKGPGKVLSNVVHRPILCLTLAALLFLTLWVPTKVFFVQIEGNKNVPVERILQCAENSGICFGSGVRGLRSEKVKNSLLQQIPELSWVGVNTKGCVATIAVSERQTAPEFTEEQSKVSSLIASHDAQIKEITVTAGNALCKSGDVVSKGQVLISGYTDCGIKIQATHAKGEVYGETFYRNQLLFPRDYHQKAAPIEKNRNIFLQIGKKEIKLCKGSGISGAICDKMYASYYLTLPGGFQLPFGIKVETFVYYRPDSVCIPEEQASQLMEHQARQYLVSGMISGKILSQKQIFSAYDGLYCLTGRYVCREMIGRIQYEKIGAYHEQTYGKDSKRGSG